MYEIYGLGEHSLILLYLSFLMPKMGSVSEIPSLESLWRIEGIMKVKSLLQFPDTYKYFAHGRYFKYIRWTRQSDLSHQANVIPAHHKETSQGWIYIYYPKALNYG